MGEAAVEESRRMDRMMTSRAKQCGVTRSRTDIVVEIIQAAGKTRTLFRQITRGAVRPDHRARLEQCRIDGAAKYLCWEGLRRDGLE